MADVHIGVSIAQVDVVLLAQMRDYMAAHAKELPGVTLQFEFSLNSGSNDSVCVEKYPRDDELTPRSWTPVHL